MNNRLTHTINAIDKSPNIANNENNMCVKCHFELQRYTFFDMYKKIIQLYPKIPEQ